MTINIIIDEEPDAIQRNLFYLTKSRGIIDKLIHDANIIALMQHFDISHLITSNPEDFSAFPSITVLVLGGFWSLSNRRTSPGGSIVRAGS